jgi:NitT/TauT family transport system substrate-binding protein
MLKAASVCATEPERAARALVDQGFTPRFDHAVQVMRELPYDRWREFDPEDTLRSYALRLHRQG